MIDYDLYCKLKHAAAAGHTPPQIAQALHLHVQTVRRWLALERYARRRDADAPRPSKLDAYKGAIARWLETHPLSLIHI